MKPACPCCLLILPVDWSPPSCYDAKTPRVFAFFFWFGTPTCDPHMTQMFTVKIVLTQVFCFCFFLPFLPFWLCNQLSISWSHASSLPKVSRAQTVSLSPAPSGSMKFPSQLKRKWAMISQTVCQQRSAGGDEVTAHKSLWAVKKEIVETINQFSFLFI